MILFSFRLLVAISMAMCHSLAVGEETADLEITLLVPPRIAAIASQRAEGNAKAPTPVLVIEDVEVRSSQRLRVEVRSKKSSSRNSGQFLGSASTIAAKKSPSLMQKMTFSIPLDDKVLPELIDKDEVTFILRIRPSRAAASLRNGKIYFYSNPVVK